MRIFEVDTTSLAKKLQALMNDPAANENIRAIAKKKYDELKLSQSGSRTPTKGEKWSPEITTTSSSGYVSPVTSQNWDNVFILRDGHRISFFEMLSRVQRLAPSVVAFRSGDNAPSKLATARNTFSAKSRPEITLTFPEADFVLDQLRQLTQIDWSVTPRGRAVLDIKYVPNQNFSGDRKSE